MNEILQVIGATVLFGLFLFGMACAVAVALLRTKRSEDETK